MVGQFINDIIIFVSASSAALQSAIMCRCVWLIAWESRPSSSIVSLCRFFGIGDTYTASHRQPHVSALGQRVKVAPVDRI